MKKHALPIASGLLAIVTLLCLFGHGLVLQSEQRRAEEIEANKAAYHAQVEAQNQNNQLKADATAAHTSLGAQLTHSQELTRALAAACARLQGAGITIKECR